MALPAMAQTTDAPSQKVEKIEVTGSSIKRIDGETALPVQILKREDIQRIAAATTEELVKQVTAITSAGSITASQANGTVTGSQSTISLRALGSARTLVLINGRRSAVFGGTSSTAVDINSIPISAIERIEVLKDGASSLYGSDAVAGVVNFILRKDYQGGEVSITTGSPTQSGGGKTNSISVFAGFGDLGKDKYNITLGAGYSKIDQIMGSDRAYAHQYNVGEGNDLSSTIAFPGNILYGPGFARLASPAFPNCGPTGIVSPFFVGNVSSGNACRFENSPFLSVQPGSEKTNVLANGHFALSGDTEAYVEAGFTRNKTTFATQPVPIAESTALPASNPYVAYINNLINTKYPTLPAGLRVFATRGNTLVLLPTTSPYYPSAAYIASLGLTAGQPIAFRYRDFANGLRSTEDVVDNTRFVAGIKGSASGWDYDSGFLFSQSKVSENLKSGFPLYSQFLPLLDSGVINPFGPTTDPSALAAAKAAELVGSIYTSKTSTTGIDAKASREIYQLPAGMVMFAVGGEYRQEKFTFSPSTPYQIGDVAGYGGNILGVDKSRHVVSGYTEFTIPILKKLEADIAVRYDRYETVGSTTNPKASIRWQPYDWLLLRGATGTGFRAPSLTDLYAAQASSVTANGSRDPIRCPNPATGAPSDCNVQFPTITGGNPNLKPEKSESNTLGMVIEPIKNLSIGVDAFWITLKDQIVGGGLSAAFILSSAANATQYSNFIIRGAPDGNPSGVGPIVGILQNTSNLFKVKVSGVDLDVNYRMNLFTGHKLTTRLNGTYMVKFDSQRADGTYGNSIDQALSASGGVIPRWRHTASATYEVGPWAASLSQNFQKGYNDTKGNFATAFRRVGNYETYDTQVSYVGFKGLKLIAGIKNLMDRDPPYTNSAGQFAAGYDINYADVRGRFVYGTAIYSFK
jgi:iron complex outermembrane receptor protein